MINTATYRAQCKTFAIARRISNTHIDASSLDHAFMPPFCLRIVRQHRTPAMQDFRNSVATAARMERNNGN